MEAAKRLSLIRAKLKRPLLAPKPSVAGLHRATELCLPPRKHQPYQHPNGNPWIVFGRGGYSHVQEPVMGWIGEPDKKPEKPRVAPKKRRKGKHYLSEIVEKMPGKLPKLIKLPGEAI